MSGFYESQNYIRLLEQQECMVNDYMDQHKDVNAKMRTVLVDWLWELWKRLQLRPETMFTSVQLVDRYLTVTIVHRDKLQLLGCICMWVAAKYHEIFYPEAKDFIFMSANTFSSDQMYNMEYEVLERVGWKLEYPTVFHFLQWYQPDVPCHRKESHVAHYLVSVTLQEYTIHTQYYPSQIARAAMYVADSTLRDVPLEYQGGNPEEVREYQGIPTFSPCSSAKIVKCANLLLNLVNHPDPKYLTIHKQYASRDRSFVSNWSFPAFVF